MALDTAKVKVNICEDRSEFGPRGGRRYRLEKWVFSRNTGVTLDHDTHVAEGLTLKEARELKRWIIDTYYS